MMRDNDPLQDWPAFVDAATKRLHQGRVDYGDASFDREPDELLRELAQEAMDLAGWGYILWHRIQEMRRALRVSRLTRDTEPCVMDGSELDRG